MNQSSRIPEGREATMRAARITQPGVVAIENVPVPVPELGQVRVRLEGCGVCHSNLPPWEGRPWFEYPMEPGMLGHEGWGRIDAVGEGVSGLSIGDRVSMLSNHAYAEYDVAYADAVAQIPGHLAAKPFPGEPLGCAVNIFRRSQILPGQDVAIVGVGFLGALLTRLASLVGARVIAVSRRGFSLSLAKQMGAHEVVPMNDHWEVIGQVSNLTGGRFCDVVIEAVGLQWPLDLAAEITRERGRLVIAGYHQDGLRQVNLQLWNWRGLDVINAHEREQQVYIDGIRGAADIISAGDIDPSPLYTHRFPLENLADALNMTRERPDGFIKALVTL